MKLDNSSIEIPLEKLSPAQKWEVFEWLKKDLGVEEMGPQEWHFDVLAERERKLASGETRLMPVEEFVAEMRKMMP